MRETLINHSNLVKMKRLWMSMWRWMWMERWSYSQCYLRWDCDLSTPITHSLAHTRTQFVFDIKHNLFLSSSRKQYKTTDSNLDDKQQKTYVLKCVDAPQVCLRIFWCRTIEFALANIFLACLSKEFSRKTAIKKQLYRSQNYSRMTA